MPLQWLLTKAAPRARRVIPQRFHRALCAAVGVRVVAGAFAGADGPRLIVANHLSWLDISALGSCTPVTFLAKREVADWPVVGRLAQLQGCVFVERAKKRAIPQVNQRIAASLQAGNTLVLFPEATTGDGNRLLRFSSAHVQAAVNAAVEAAASAAANAASAQRVWLLPVAIVYTRRSGLPYDRLTRPTIAWYGDMALLPHLWDIMRDGPVDCELRAGEPLLVTPSTNRKTLTRQAEHDIRLALARGRRTPAPPENL